MSTKESIIALLHKLPYLRGLPKGGLFVPAGHYYSPLVSKKEIQNRERLIWDKVNVDGIKGIELNTNTQLQLAMSFTAYYAEIPFGAQKLDHLRYYFENPFYSYADGITLYGMMRHFKPNRIVEIGSGFSSALMLDTNELFFDNKIALTFIEPYPERLYSLLKEKERSCEILEQPIQDVPLSTFDKLEAGDILFIDSSHVAKAGSDVVHILFEILPVIKKGVIIHFHDIFYPFEYPREWVYEERNWNEDYMLRAFLMYNPKFRIIFFPHYLHLHHYYIFEDMPLYRKCGGGSIWIERV